MKKIISFIAATALAVSAMSVSAATGGKMDNFKEKNVYTSNIYTDIAADSWYRGNVKQCYELALMLGDGNGNFNPDGYVTLAEAVTMAARVYNIYYGGSGTFDTSVGAHWYDSIVSYAEKSGIIKAGQFTDFERQATRAEMATIFATALPSDELNAINKVEAIPDVPSTDARFAAIQSLYNSGIVVGSDTARNFKPDTNIKRSEAAAIICRMAVKSSRLKIDDIKAATSQQGETAESTNIASQQTSTQTESGNTSSGGSSSSSFNGTSGKTSGSGGNSGGSSGGSINTGTGSQVGEDIPDDANTDDGNTISESDLKNNENNKTEDGPAAELGVWNATRIADEFGTVTYAMDKKDESGIFYFNFSGEHTDKDFDMSKVRIGLVVKDDIKGTVEFVGKDIRLWGSYSKVASEEELVPGTYCTQTNPDGDTFLKCMLAEIDASRINGSGNVEKINDKKDEYVFIIAMEPDWYEGSTSQYIVVQAARNVLVINDFRTKPDVYYTYTSEETGEKFIYATSDKILVPLDCEKVTFCTLKRVALKEVILDDESLSGGVEFDEVHK